MKWSPGGESQDIEDRRDQSGGGGFQFGGIHMGIGGAIVLLILSFIFKTNLFTLLGGGTGGSGTAVSQPDPSRDAAEKPLVQFELCQGFAARVPTTTEVGNMPGKRTNCPSGLFRRVRRHSGTLAEA